MKETLTQKFIREVARIKSPEVFLLAQAGVL